MVWQELHVDDVVHLLEAVDLDALVVVDVRPLLLGHSKQVLGVEPLDVVHRLLDADLAHEVLGDPVEGGHVTAPTAQGQVATVAGVVEPEIKFLCCSKHN